MPKKNRRTRWHEIHPIFECTGRRFDGIVQSAAPDQKITVKFIGGKANQAARN